MSLIKLPTISVPTDRDLELLNRVDEGMRLQEQGDFWGAEQIYKQVLAERPGHPRATAMLGVVAYMQGDMDKSMELMADAASRDISDPVLHGNRAAVLQEMGRHEDAYDAYRMAVEAWPGYAIGYSNASLGMLETFRQDQAVYAITRACELDPEHYPYTYQKVFTLDLCASTTLEAAHEIRRLINDRYILPLLNLPREPYTNPLTSDRKIRIGYVSSDFHQHSAVHAISSQILFYDRDRFEVICYASVTHPDSITEKLQAAATSWVDVVGWTEEKIAEKIREDQIDILVDLSLYSRGNHLLAFARHPAPVQITAWGYATHSALDCFEYVFSDSVVSPRNYPWKTHEQVYRLPALMSWLPASQLMGDEYDNIDTGHMVSAFERPFTFGVFNRPQKITIPSIKTWCEILRRAPASRLIVKNQLMEYDQVRNRLISIFESERVYRNEDGSERVLFASKSIHGNHLSAHWAIDVMLDSWPQTGGISTFESIWMGVPVLTYAGSQMPARISATILSHLGLNDWITTSPEAYIDKAVQLATSDPMDLVPLRSQLRGRLLNSIMCKGEEYTKTVEEAYTAIWKGYLEKAKTEGLA